MGTTMKKLIIILLGVFVILPIFAQEISEMRVVGQAEQLTGEIISKDVRDINGDQCAGLIILTGLTGLTFNSNNGFCKDASIEPGKYFLFLTQQERIVTVLKEGYLPLKILLNDYGISTESGKVWEIKVTGDKKLDEIPVNIITIPNGAEIWIDGINKGTTITHQLSLGIHDLRVVKSGFSTHTEMITVDAGHTYFNFTLQEIEPTLVKIRSNPPRANLSIDNISKGVTNKDLFLFPGEYQLKLSLTGFIDIMKRIEVKENQDNEFSYTLN